MAYDNLFENSSSAPEAQDQRTPVERVLSERRKMLYGNQLESQKTRDLLIAVIGMETSRTKQDRMLNVLESLGNRVDDMNTKFGMKHTLVSALHTGFYGPVNRGRLDASLARVTNAERKNFDKVVDSFLNGSNRINLATDQGMKREIRGKKWNRDGEWYGHWCKSADWANSITHMAMNGEYGADRIASSDAHSIVGRFGSGRLMSMRGDGSRAARGALRNHSFVREVAEYTDEGMRPTVHHRNGARHPNRHGLKKHGQIHAGHEQHVRHSREGHYSHTGHRFEGHMAHRQPSFGHHFHFGR